MPVAALALAGPRRRRGIVETVTVESRLHGPLCCLNESEIQKDVNESCEAKVSDSR